MRRRTPKHRRLAGDDASIVCPKQVQASSSNNNKRARREARGQNSPAGKGRTRAKWPLLLMDTCKWVCVTGQEGGRGWGGMPQNRRENALYRAAGAHPTGMHRLLRPLRKNARCVWLYVLARRQGPAPNQSSISAQQFTGSRSFTCPAGRACCSSPRPRPCAQPRRAGAGKLQALVSDKSTSRRHTRAAFGQRTQAATEDTAPSPTSYCPLTMGQRAPPKPHSNVTIRPRPLAEPPLTTDGPFLRACCSPAATGRQAPPPAAQHQQHHPASLQSHATPPPAALQAAAPASPPDRAPPLLPALHGGPYYCYCYCRLHL